MLNEFDFNSCGIIIGRKKWKWDTRERRFIGVESVVDHGNEGAPRSGTEAIRKNHKTHKERKTSREAIKNTTE